MINNIKEHDGLEYLIIVNGNVRDFNTAIQVFPTNVINAILKFKAYDFFQAGEEEKAPVQVKF